jgi:serine protease Do
LKSGRFVDHASLGATVSADSDSRVVVDDILENSDAYRRGLRYNDELLRFAGRDIGSPNAFKNALGTFPAGWHVPLTYRRDGKEFDIIVRLAAAHREGELEQLLQQEEEPHPKSPGEPPGKEEPPHPGDKPKPKDPEKPESHPPSGEPQVPGFPKRAAAKANRPPAVPKSVRKYFEAAPGYANYWFNRYHQQRIWNAYLAHGDFAEVGWNWKVKAKTTDGKSDVAIDLTEKNGSVTMPEGQSGVEFGNSLIEATGPPRSGGLLAALHLWQRMLLVGPRKFGEVYYLGTMPWKSDDTLADCLVATAAGVETRFYFDTEKSNLVGLELYTSEDDDPCEIAFDDIRAVDGRSLPHHWTIRHGDDTFADINITSYDFGAATKPEDKPK